MPENPRLSGRVESTTTRFAYDLSWANVPPGNCIASVSIMAESKPFRRDSFFFPSFLSLLRAIKLDIVSNYSNCPFELKEKLKEEERKRMEKEETKKERSLIRQDKGGGKKEEKKKDK